MNDMVADNSYRKPDEFPDTLLEEAALWFARLREPEPDSQQAAERRMAFEDWLQADPRHRGALEETERLWGALAQPAATAIAEESVSKPQIIRHRRRALPSWSRPAALAASFLVAMAFGLIAQDDLTDWVHADHTTRVGEQIPVNLEDGSRVTLNTDTAVSVDLSPNRRSVGLLRGQAWFDVAADTSRPFFVESPAGTIKVTGTSFDVHLDHNTTIVSVTEGQVALTATQGAVEHPTAKLHAGQQARISKTGISEVRAFDNTVVTAWLRQQLVFYDTPLEQVVDELNRYRSGKIVIADGDLQNLKVSGVFRTDDPDAALPVIANTLPIEVTRLTNYLVLLH